MARGEVDQQQRQERKMNRVGIGWKEVDEDSNEKGRKCRCSVTNEAIFKMGCIVITHIHAIHLL